MPACVWQSRAEDGRRDWCNQTWLAFTGRTEEEELGAGWTEGVHPDDLDGWFEAYRTAFARGAPFATEYRLRRHDGAYRWMAERGRPFTDEDGEFGGYVGVSHDVDDHRRRTQRLRDDRTTTTLFLQTLYHDLRSPLASMAMAVSSLQDERLTSAQREQLLAVLGRNLERARGVVDEVQLLEQSQSGALRPQREVVDVGALLESVVTRLAVGDHPVAVVDELGRAAIDPVIIDRAIENLVTNAVTHTPTGTPIEVRAMPHGRHLRFVVRDEGPGSDRAVLDAALEPRPTQRCSSTGGLGLGLSLAERYAEAHGGRLDISAAPGRGTEVAIVVPAASAGDGDS